MCSFPFPGTPDIIAFFLDKKMSFSDLFSPETTSSILLVLHGYKCIVLEVFVICAKLTVWYADNIQNISIK
jgi:hypothetical protein